MALLSPTQYPCPLSRLPRPLARGGGCLLIAATFASSLIAEAETSIEINDLSGPAFTLAASQTFTEAGTSPLGSYQFTVSTNTGGVSRENGTVTLLPVSDEFGSMQLGYVFDQPVDLAAKDYIGIDLTHGMSNNPVNWIMIYLENGSVLEMQNLWHEPFLPSQKKFPIYDLKSRFGSSRLHPTRVKSLHIFIGGFSSGPGTNVVVDSVHVTAIAAKPPLSLIMTLGGIRDVIVTTNRQIGTNEIYRLEASNNLIDWFDKANKVRGYGSAPVFEKYFNDAKFYRMSYYNYVDVSAH
jgi:hypothetical protein